MWNWSERVMWKVMRKLRESDVKSVARSDVKWQECNSDVNAIKSVMRNSARQGEVHTKWTDLRVGRHFWIYILVPIIR